MAEPENPVNPGAGSNPAPAPQPPSNPRDWLNDLPEDIRTHNVFKTVSADNPKDAFAQVAKQLVGVQPLIGSKTVKPASDWSPEQVKAWYQEVLGVPKDETGYAIDSEKYKSVLDEKGAASLRKLFVDSNFTPKQAEMFTERVLGEAIKDQQARVEQEQAVLKQWDETMKKEWGAAYEEKQKQVDYAVSKLAENNPELTKLLEVDPTLANNPGFKRAMLRVGELMTDPKATEGFKGSQPVGGNLSHPIDIQRRLNEIGQDPVYVKTIAAGGVQALISRARIANDAGAFATASLEAQRFDALVKERTELYAKLSELEKK